MKTVQDEVLETKEFNRVLTEQNVCFLYNLIIMNELLFYVLKLDSTGSGNKKTDFLYWFLKGIFKVFAALKFMKR